MGKRATAQPVIEEELEPTHRVVTPIRHNGKYYAPDSRIGLNAEDAERLEGLGAATPLTVLVTEVAAPAASETPAE